MPEARSGRVNALTLIPLAALGYFPLRGKEKKTVPEARSGRVNALTLIPLAALGYFPLRGKKKKTVPKPRSGIVHSYPLPQGGVAEPEARSGRVNALTPIPLAALGYFPLRGKVRKSELESGRRPVEAGSEGR